MQTKSKNFKDHEIRGILPDGSIYLKTGVKRKNYNDSIDPNSLESHLNQELLIMKSWEDFYRKVVGVDDFSND